MRRNREARKSGLVRKINTIILTGIMVVSVFLGIVNFVPQEVAAHESAVDPYGYTFMDNKEPDPKTAYSWIDGVTGGTATGLGDDQNTGFIAMGLSINYYGTTYTDVAICSNGWASFVDISSTDYDPDAIPDIDAPWGTIAAFWTNLDPSALGAEVYFKAEANRFIITWLNVPIFGTSELQTFEIVIFDSNEILFQYMSIDMPLPSNPPFAWPGVGIEMGGLGEIGLGYDDVIESGLAISFIPVPPMFPENLAITSTNLAPSNAEQGESDIGIIALTLTANSGTIGLSSFSVTKTGSIAETDISNIEVWHDRNNNGILEVVMDRPIASGTYLFGMAGLSISAGIGSCLVIRAGHPQSVIITYDISPTAPVGDTAGINVQAANVVPGTDTVSGLPASSSNLQVSTQTPDTLSVVCTSLQSGSATASKGEAMVPMALLSLSASANRVDIYYLEINLSSMSNIKYFDVFARVFHDVDDNGQFDATIDIEVGTSRFFPSSVAIISILDPPGYFRVNSGITERLIIAYDIGYTADLGSFAYLRIDESNIIINPTSPDSVLAAGFPFTSNPIEVVGFAQPVILSPFTENPPTVDGRYESGEWADATSISLLNIRGNGIETIFQVMNDNENIYMVIDAVGDTTRNSLDVSSVCFDTGHDEIATAGEEDQFVIGGWFPDQTAHYVFDTPGTGWTVEDSPFNTGLPGHTNLVGGWGFDTSDNSGTWHRFYEYRIPLALLGVSTPPPPGYTLGLGVGREDIFTSSYTPGVYDPTLEGTGNTNASYWPLYYADVIEDMSFLGDLVLGGIANPPVLDWTGESGYESDGVNPDTGHTVSTFEYRIKYSDTDNDPPQANYPKLYIEKPCGNPWGASPFDMSFTEWADPANPDYIHGAIYTYSTTLSPLGTNYGYYFNATDSTNWAVGVPTVPCTDGPDVDNGPPILDWTGEPNFETDGVHPDEGTVYTEYEWRIKYSDADNDPPAADYPKLHIHKPCGVQAGGGPYKMSFVEWADPANPDYIHGAIYHYLKGGFGLSGPGTDYAYFFNATDGTNWAVGVPTIPCTDGPDMLPTNTPMLDFTDEAGYESDGVEPDIGTAGVTWFEFRVKYWDIDNDTPEAGAPKLYINKPCGTPWGGPYLMNFAEWVLEPFNYNHGAIYSYSMQLSSEGTDYGHYFNASDGVSWAVGAATTCTDGPDVVIGITPGPPSHLEVHRASPHVDLKWDVVGNAEEYRIYNSQDKFLDFGSWNLLGSTTGTTYTHNNGMNSQTQYYIVKAYNTAGGEGPPSSMGVVAYRSYVTGVLDSAQQWFSLPHNSMYKKASDITDELTESKVTVIGKWDSSKQKSIIYWFFRGRWRGSDFNIDAGDGLWFRTVSDFDWYVNGTDRSLSLNFVYKSAKRNINWISLPYTGNYATASEIVMGIEGGIGPGFSTKISAVVKWDHTTQTEIRYEYDLVLGWVGTDFSIEPMDGIYLEVIANFNWPPELVTPPVPP